MASKKVQYESKEQKSLFLWLELRHPNVWEMAYHIPNGGKRNKIEAANLKKQGVKAGYPDINIDIPSGKYHGLRIEFKATPPHDCVVSKSQKEWLDKLTNMGYRAVVCKGLDSAKEEINDYLK